MTNATAPAAILLDCTASQRMILIGMAPIADEMIFRYENDAVGTERMISTERLRAGDFTAYLTVDLG